MREPWGRDLGGLPSPVAAVGLHEQHRCQFAFCDPLWPGADRVSVAVAFPRALARLAPGRVVHRGADLDDRLHPPHGHVRSRRPTGELVDLALEAVSCPRPPPASAKPYGAAHGFHRRLDPCDRPARRTDPAVLVLAAARSRSSASASGRTRAPDLTRLRSGAEVNAGCPGKHIKANRCRGRAAPDGRGHTDGMRARGSVWAFQEPKRRNGSNSRRPAWQAALLVVCLGFSWRLHRG